MAVNDAATGQVTEDDTCLTVFYDGACPLCSKEIGFYRRRTGADAIDWVDVSRAGPGEVAPGVTREEALRRFHVMHPDGRISAEGQAIADLWTALPALRPAGRLFRTRPLAALLDRLYRIFLPVRPWLQRRFKPVR